MSIHYIKRVWSYGGAPLEVCRKQRYQSGSKHAWHVHEKDKRWVWATASTELEAHIAMNSLNARAKDPTP